MNRTATLRTSLLAALVGGAVVAAAMLALDLGREEGKTTTVIQQSPLTATRDSDQPGGTGGGLTPREIYKRDAPGVVNVRAQVVQQVDSPFDLGPEQDRGQSSGSGFVLDRHGFILTNAHVIEGASRVTVQFEDDKVTEAKVVGKDTSTDLAVLKVDPKDLDLKPLALGDSKDVQVGDPTIAIGNPFGLDRTLTTGVVSALQRRITAPNGFQIENVIQTDAAINPGNSGGPLLDAAGRVIGINSQIATGGAGNGNVGIAFAVPINTAKQVIPQLRREGKVERAYIGITGATIDASLARLNLASKSGVLVQSVQAGSPAAKAGIRGGDAQANLDGSDIALGGDVITKIDDRTVKSMDDVVAVINGKKPGDSVTLQLVRDGQPRTVKVKLAQRPSEAPQQ
ncbi:MAG TPA: trypsin-like peptidase domain-containing protein [Solirubrobacteraceae bacterium]|nr:trypsin-like peptidase domain-containing protein [Solirubrobacteraceae bacterium]